MAVEVKVPRLAESISEAVLVAWLKQDGEPVAVDEPIATLETDKAAVELPAGHAGVLRHAKKLGDKVVVGDTIARIEEGATPPSTGGAGTAPGTPASAPIGRARPEPAGRGSPRPAPTSPAHAPQRQPLPPRGPEGQDREAEPPLSPSVRRMIEEHGLDPGAIAATGAGGRLLKEDVIRHLENPPGTAAARPAGPAPASPVPAPPLPPREPQPSPPTGPARAPAEWAEGETERAVPMSRIRQRIAERLVRAQQTAAILTTFNEVDMSAVMELRARHRDSFEKRHGVKLSYLGFFTRACVLALQQTPELNAEIRGQDIVYHRHVHIGIAVGTERGLVVPVVHHADQRGFAEIEKEIARLAVAARENRLSLDDLSAGTFTISNGGVYGSLLSTPILNPPQSGILGMHKIQKRPIAVEDRVEIRPMMYLALSYDHRIVDGEQAVTFLVSVKERLEDPERMLIDV